MCPFFCFPNIQEIDLLFEDVDFYTSLTHACFEELCQDAFQSTLDPDEKELRYSMVNKSNVHKIILVGGSAHIPCIIILVSDFFNGKKPTSLSHQPLHLGVQKQKQERFVFFLSLHRSILTLLFRFVFKCLCSSSSTHCL